MSQRSRYAGRSLALLTLHGKERVIARVLEPGLGCSIELVTSFATYQLGTFTRVIPRSGTQREAARRKARKGMELSVRCFAGHCQRRQLRPRSLYRHVSLECGAVGLVMTTLALKLSASLRVPPVADISKVATSGKLLTLPSERAFLSTNWGRAPMDRAIRASTRTLPIGLG